MRFFRLNRFALLAIQSTSPCRRSRYTPVGMGARSAGEFSARSLAWPSMSSCHIPAPGASFACIGVAVPVKPPLAKDSFARQKRREALLKSATRNPTPSPLTSRLKRAQARTCINFFVLEIPPEYSVPVWKGGR